jgi:hypothetical protein
VNDFSCVTIFADLRLPGCRYFGTLVPVCVYYCRTYYKAVRGGGRWRAGREPEEGNERSFQGVSELVERLKKRIPDEIFRKGSI